MAFRSPRSCAIAFLIASHIVFNATPVLVSLRTMVPHDHSHSHSSTNAALSSHDGGHSHDHEHAGGGVEQAGRGLDAAFSMTVDDDNNGRKHGGTAAVESLDALERRSAMRRLKIATVLCVAFFAVEVVGGLLAGSLAVLSDAAHLFSDLASFIVAIFANYLASLPSTSQHTFGLKRSESLAALFSMVSLALVCVWLGWEAIRRLYVMVTEPDSAADVYQVDGKLMSGIAGIGVMVNLALAWVLGAEGHVHMPGADHGHSHSHHEHHDGDGGQDDHDHASEGHSHSHEHSQGQEASDQRRHDEETALLSHSPSADCSYTIEHANEVPPPFAPEKPRNVNLHAAYLHVLGDLAQSVAVLIAGIVIWIQPTWVIVDPLCTLGFCILVFYSTLSVVRSSIAVLLEEVPPQISWKAIYGDLTAITHLEGLHDLHIWCISDGVPCLSLHAYCDDGDCDSALRRIKEVCRKHGVEHVTAQVQPTPGACITCDAVPENTTACFDS